MFTKTCVSLWSLFTSKRYIVYFEGDAFSYASWKALITIHVLTVSAQQPFFKVLTQVGALGGCHFTFSLVLLVGLTCEPEKSN